MKAFTAKKIFTGEDHLPHHAVIVEGDMILDVLPLVSVPEDVVVENIQAQYIVPSFIDLQLYGSSGKLFSVYPEAGTLKAMHDHCISGGTSLFLPTIATNNIKTVHAAIDALMEYWANDGRGIPGLHLEGPWINPIKRGAHIESLIHPPTLEEVKSLLEYGKHAIKVITLAPEVCSTEIIHFLEDEGIIISAGHSNLSYGEALQCFRKGISVVTHLYNAMSPLQHRAPGLPAAVFQHPTVMASIIPDGYHVDYTMINIAKKLMGDRLFIITDAVTTTEEGFYPHQLQGDKYVSNGILSGSALTMIKGVKNLVDHVEIHLEEALRMASLYPARVLKLEHAYGRIKKGFTADLLFLDEHLNVMHHYQG